MNTNLRKPLGAEDAARGRWVRWGRRLAACALLAALQWAGDAVVERTGWPVSGSIVGMLALLGLLAARGGVPASLQTVATPLLRHLMLLLIPSVAAVSIHAGLLVREGAVFLAVSVGATVLAALATAWTLARLMRGRPRQP